MTFSGTQGYHVLRLRTLRFTPLVVHCNFIYIFHRFENANCSQTMIDDTVVISTDSPREREQSLPNSTIVDS